MSDAKNVTDDLSYIQLYIVEIVENARTAEG